jgi:hypothetical protein
MMSGKVLLLTYTPRPDADLDAYHAWLREVDNPFFNSRPVVRRYVNYRVARYVLGSERFSHFDLLEIADRESAEAVFGDAEIDRFARDWVRQWGIQADPDAADQSVNYRVLECEAVAWPDAPA